MEDSLQEQEGSHRAIAWLVVVAVHATLLWLFTLGPVGRTSAPANDVRTQLVLIARAPVARLPDAPPPTTTPARPAVTFTPPQPAVATPTPAQAPMPATAPDPAPIDWQQQARDSAHRQLQSDAPAFAADPLRSRRARLPGGTQPARFRMAEPITPAQVAGFIGQLFGGQGDPCPRVHRNIAGLLTTTSDHDRELLTEELRQYRDYCQP